MDELSGAVTHVTVANAGSLELLCAEFKHQGLDIVIRAFVADPREGAERRERLLTMPKERMNEKEQ